MTILFSPIGTADPITQLGDGPMLHIVRHRNPDKVVLFLSPAMARHQRDDGRYVDAIGRLSDRMDRERPDIVLVESCYDDVHHFDHYLVEFEEVLAELALESSETPVLVNVSSGTPAMEQALVALGSFGVLDLEMLQVATPKRGINSRNDREDPLGYDLETLWELNSENPENEKSRIEVVGTPNFRNRLLRENARALIRKYDYEAAYDLVSGITDLDPQIKDRIKAAADRLRLDGQSSSSAFKGTGLGYRNDDPLWEYLYTMEVKLRQGRYDDFIRAMTPALTSCMMEELRPVLHEEKYLVKDRRGLYTGRLDESKIRSDEKLSNIVLRNGKMPSKYVGNALLCDLVRNYCEDAGNVQKIEELRKVEENCRNGMAHQLLASTRKRIEDKIGGHSLEDVMGLFFELHGNMEPGLYDRINALILEKL